MTPDHAKCCKAIDQALAVNGGGLSRGTLEAALAPMPAPLVGAALNDLCAGGYVTTAKRPGTEIRYRQLRRLPREPIATASPFAKLDVLDSAIVEVLRTHEHLYISSHEIQTALSAVGTEVSYFRLVARLRKLGEAHRIGTIPPAGSRRGQRYFDPDRVEAVA
jgi:hypothetical protein